MILNLAGHEGEVDINELEGIASLSTGRGLRRVQTTFTVRGDIREDVAAALAAAKSDDDGDPLAAGDGTTWHVERSSYSYMNDGPTEFDVTLVEAEALQVDSIEFLGLRLPVDRYTDETTDDRILIVRVLATTDAETTEGFIEKYIADSTSSNGTFDLVRPGIGDAPLVVRFGQVLWQAHDDGSRTWCINFVDERHSTADPEKAGAGLFEPALTNLGIMASKNQTAIARLIAELVGAGILDEAAAARIRPGDNDVDRLRAHMDVNESRNVQQYF